MKIPALDGSPPDWPQALRRYLAFMLLANLVWEFAHLPLYTIWDTAPPAQMIFAAAHCTLGDVLIATMALVLALALAGAPSWPQAAYRRITLLATAGGVAYTVFSEWLNIVVRQAWQYAPEMPVVPLLDVGISPLLQWLVLPPLGLWFARRVRLNAGT